VTSSGRQQRLLRNGVAGVETFAVVDAHGTRLRLDDGRDVIDAMTTPAPLGHRHPRVVEAVRAALDAPTLDEGWATPRRLSAADALIDTALAGEDWVGAVRFAVTGSEANDLALSLAQALTGRSALVTRERAYHGMVGLARDVTVQPQWHGGLSSSDGTTRPVPASVPVRALPFPPGSLSDGVELTRAGAEAVLAGADAALCDAAAVIVDYTQGGCYPAPAYQDVLAEKARAAGALWIADEVITGLGKTGRWFNFQRGERRPDMVTLGKSMGGGLVAAAAVVISRELLDEMSTSSWQNYSALRSSDIAAAATSALIEVVEEDGLVRRAGVLHERLRDGMAALARAHPSVSRIDGHGLHWWVEIGDADWRAWSGAGSAPTLAGRIAARVLEAGVLVATSGEANVLLVTLPLTIEDADVEQVLAALDHGLDLADDELRSAGPA
jgi:4-aminobutyrate aminotransferase-like enzyme